MNGSTTTTYHVRDTTPACAESLSGDKGLPGGLVVARLGEWPTELALVGVLEDVERLRPAALDVACCGFCRMGRHDLCGLGECCSVLVTTREGR